MSIELNHQVHQGSLIHKYSGFADFCRLIDYESKKHLVVLVEDEGEVSPYIIDRKNPQHAINQLLDYWKLWNDRKPLFLVFEYTDLLKGD